MSKKKRNVDFMVLQNEMLWYYNKSICKLLNTTVNCNNYMYIVCIYIFSFKAKATLYFN